MGATINYFPAVSGGAASCAADPWVDAVAAFVALKAPTLVNVVFRSKLCSGFTQEIEKGTLIGSGATATMDATRDGGVLKIDSGSSGSSFQIVRAANSNAAAGSAPSFVTNTRTKAWAVAARVLIGNVTATANMNIVHLGDETANDISLGVAGATSTTNWSIATTGLTTQNTGVALPTVAFATVVLIADGTNLSAWNVDTGVQIGTNIAQSTIPAAAMHPSMYSLGTNAGSNSAFIDDWAMITLPAA